MEIVLNHRVVNRLAQNRYYQYSVVISKRVCSRKYTEREHESFGSYTFGTNMQRVKEKKKNTFVHTNKLEL